MAQKIYPHKFLEKIRPVFRQIGKVTEFNDEKQQRIETVNEARAALLMVEAAVKHLREIFDSHDIDESSGGGCSM